jgi:hypothetical protein
MWVINPRCDGASSKRLKYSKLPAFCLIAFLLFAGCSSDKGGAPSSDLGDLSELELSFSPEEDEVLRYEAVKSMDIVTHGMEISNVESYEVEMSFKEKGKDGNSVSSVDFLKASYTFYLNGELQKREPPVELEGKKLAVEIARDGRILSAIPDGCYVTGIKDFEQLQDVVDLWVVSLPDSVVTVGDSWSETIDEMSAESEESEQQYGEEGAVEYTLVGMEEKDGVMAAVIKSTLNVRVRHQAMGGGVMEAEGKGQGEYYVAVDGGYVVESNERIDFKGVVKGGMMGGSEGMETGFTVNYESDLKR